MAVTRLQRKERKNKSKAAQRKASIKRLLAKPVIKNVVIEKQQEASLHKQDPYTSLTAEV